MKKTNLIIIGTLLFSLILINIPSQASAQSTNDIYYEEAILTCTINPSGSVDAQMEFTMVNDSLLTDIQSASRTIPSTDIENVEVYDDSGNPLPYDVKVEEEKTTIKVHFNGRMGPGDQLTYFVTFSALNFVSKEGSKYVGTFGQLSLDPNDTPYNRYVVNIHGPSGSELFTYEPTGTTITGENLSYETQLEPPEDFSGVQGIWYRSPVYYELTLTESISNPETEEVTDLEFDLMLFNKDDNWQIPAFLETTGSLKSIYVDEENNWRGVFDVGNISPGETEEFQVKLVHQASVHDPDITASEVGGLSEVPSEFDSHLGPLDYWPVDNATMQSAAESAVGDMSNCYLVAKKIMNFVNNHLQYEVQADRLGALQAYLGGKGDCSEYTDLTITLSRAVGLPARASYGWGYSDNELIGHAWPEFYFPGVGWEPADPTWTDTGGEISPGGLHPRPHPPGRPFGKLAPTLAGATGSYLARLDTIHIQRNLRWLNSTESRGEKHYYGAEPAISENKSIKIITESEAATDFLSAAQFATDRASNMLEKTSGESELNLELNRAENYLTQAESESDASQKILLSQQAILHADKVIQELGEPPTWEKKETQLDLQDIYLIIIIITVAAALIGGTIYVTRKKAG